MRWQWRWIVVVLGLVAFGCGPAKQDTATRGSTSPSGENRNACRLLTPDELNDLEPSVVLRNVVAEEPTYSECHFEDKNGIVLITLKVYWAGGRQQWETWRLAQGLGQQILKEQEGVGPNDVIKQGLVPGLGDGAYFSPLLPSLLLKGDVLVEITMPTVENAEAKFKPLAIKLLDRIK